MESGVVNICCRLRRTRSMVATFGFGWLEVVHDLTVFSWRELEGWKSCRVHSSSRCIRGCLTVLSRLSACLMTRVSAAIDAVTSSEGGGSHRSKRHGIGLSWERRSVQGSTSLAPAFLLKCTDRMYLMDSFQTALLFAQTKKGSETVQVCAGPKAIRRSDI